MIIFPKSWYRTPSGPVDIKTENRGGFLNVGSLLIFLNFLLSGLREYKRIKE